MKKLQYLLVFIFVGIFVSNFFKGIFSNFDEDEAPQAASKKIETYGELGTANDWPAIEEGFAEVADNVSATNYYLVIDGSGSMADTGCSDGREKLAVAKDSLKQFVSKIPADANIGVFAFDRAGIGERLPLGSNSEQQVFNVLGSIRASGGTPLSLAISAGAQALTNQAKRQLGYGEYHLVVVTDGEANSGYEPDREVEKLLQNSPIVLHTVGFCINDRHSLNQPGYTLYKAANDPASLAAGLDAVLAEAPDFSVSDFAGDN